MSDIKYIIAGDDNGEHTRFPCLAVVRYAAATVVTVLALALIALVIHAVLRSEDIRLSINDGFIGADNLWTQSNIGVSKSASDADTASSRSVAVRRTRQTTDSSPFGLGGSQGDDLPLDSSPFGLGGSQGDDLPPYKTGGSQGDDLPPYKTGATNVTLQRANTTNIRVTLIANNPGGRANVECNQTNVTLIDMQSPNPYVIGTLQLGNFTLLPQTTITLQKRLKITDLATLNYIWNNYGGQISFTVTVRVSASVTSYPLGKKTQTKKQTYVCRLVTVGLLDQETYLAADEDTECRASPWQTPAPAPAPAPAR